MRGPRSLWCMLFLPYLIEHFDHAGSIAETPWAVLLEQGLILSHEQYTRLEINLPAAASNFTNTKRMFAIAKAVYRFENSC
ncbi:hypothetical protein BJV78DRAFT_1175322 [Lactifluus subvellereus]|nr:hypothetical protein BJV78DRAFT_1175322 [Lactifluus subvellereus]